MEIRLGNDSGSPMIQNFSTHLFFSVFFFLIPNKS